MTGITLHPYTPPSVTNNQMVLAVTNSLVFHIFVIVVLAMGLPFLKPDIPEPEVAMEIEFIEEDVSEFKPEEKIEEFPEPPPPEPAKEEPKQEKPKPDVAPKVTNDTPPPLPAEPAPEPEVTEQEIVETLAPVVVPPPVKKPQVKPEKPMLTQDNVSAFQSVLKNLTPDAPEERQQPKQDTPAGEERASRFSSQPMSMSEQSALRQQLSQCWKLMAGARYAEDLVVDIRLHMNPDATVQSSQIMDQLRYNTDSFFRAAADSALRAISNPYCNPLKLPPQKFDTWKVMTVRFDPRNML